MLQGLLTPCKKCIKEKCGLWVTLTWKNETTKEEKKESECAITGIYKFMARLDNRSIATQQASEQSRNNSAKVSAAQEVLGNNLAGVLIQSLKMISNDLRLQIDTEINKVKDVIAITYDENN